MAGKEREAAALFSSAQVDTKLSGNFTPCTKTQKFFEVKIFVNLFLFLSELKLNRTNIPHGVGYTAFTLYLPQEFADALELACAKEPP